MLQLKEVRQRCSGCSAWSRLTRLITSGRLNWPWVGMFSGLYHPAVLLLNFSVSVQSDIRFWACSVRIRPSPRPRTRHCVMKHWSTSSGSWWTLVRRTHTSFTFSWTIEPNISCYRSKWLVRTFCLAQGPIFIVILSISLSLKPVISRNNDFCQV